MDHYYLSYTEKPPDNTPVQGLEDPGLLEVSGIQSKINKRKTLKSRYKAGCLCSMCILYTIVKNLIILAYMSYK